MDTSSSNPHTAGSHPPTLTLSEFMQDFAYDDPTLPGLDVLSNYGQQNKQNGNVSSGASAGNESIHGEFFGLGNVRPGEFDFGMHVDNTDTSMVDFFAFGQEGMAQQGLGIGSGPMSGVDFTNPSFNDVNLGPFLGMDPSVNGCLDPIFMSLGDMFHLPSTGDPSQEWIIHGLTNGSEDRRNDGNTNLSTIIEEQPGLPTHPTHVRFSTPPSSVTRSSEDRTSAEGSSDAENPNTITDFASPNLKKRMFPRRKTKAAGFPGYPMPVDAKRKLDPVVLKALKILRPRAKNTKSGKGSGKTRGDSRKSRNGRSLDARAPIGVSTQEEKKKENPMKPKAKEGTIWRVYTAPNPSHDTNGNGPTEMMGEPSTAQFGAAGNVPPSSGSGSASAGSTTTSTGKRPGRRKGIFQLVKPELNDKSSEKLEWYAPRPLEDYEYTGPARRKRRDSPQIQTHSAEGWVFARMREPDYDRPQYAWAIAQVQVSFLPGQSDLSDC